LTEKTESVIVSWSMSLAVPELVLCSCPRADAGEARVTDDVLLPLVRRARCDDAQSISQLVQRIGPRLLRTVRQVLGARHPDIEDVTQDAVIGFLQALTEFRAQCSVLHFAHRIALLTALAARRRIGTRERRIAPESYEDDQLQDPRSSPDRDLLASRRRQIVRDLLDTLPESIAEAMAMHFVLGMTVDEIAAVAKVSQNTVWSRLRLGKATMRKRLRSCPRFGELLRVFE
jgi:RNA polymerase sigma factor (sigma-70 family)